MAVDCSKRCERYDLAGRMREAGPRVRGAVGAEPIPVADLPILTGIQTLMVAGVAYFAGHALSLEVAGRFFSVLGINVGAAFLLREVARALAKCLPGPGDIMSGVIAGAWTYALGQAAITYFVDEKGAEEVRTVFRRVFEFEKRIRP